MKRLSIDKVLRDGAFDKLDHVRKQGRYADVSELPTSISPLENPSALDRITRYAIAAMASTNENKNAAVDAVLTKLTRGTFPLLLVALLGMSTVGCKGVDRILNGPEPETQSTESVISSMPDMPTDAPTFNVPMPNGYTVKTVFFGELPLNGRVTINASNDARVDVFLLDRGINQWFKLGVNYSGAFYYSYDMANGLIEIKGAHLSGKGFAVYQYTK